MCDTSRYLESVSISEMLLLCLQLQTFRQHPHATAAETHARAFSTSVHRYLRLFIAPPVLDEVAQPVTQQSFHGLVRAAQRVGDDDL